MRPKSAGFSPQRAVSHLSTGGSARWSGPLGVHDFLKKMAIVNLPEDDMEELNHYAASIARAEGLTGHAHAVERRLQGR